MTQPNFSKRGGECIKEDHLVVPKVGKVRIVFHRPFPSNAKTKILTIREEGGKWFACFSFEIAESQTEPKQDLSSSIGVDMGVIDFVTTSEGEKYQPLRALSKRWKDLRRLQRKLSKTKKRTPAYRKVLSALRKAWYRVGQKRRAFLYETAQSLLRKHDAIFFEELDIRSMLTSGRKSSSLNRSILDASWGYFFAIIEHLASKCEKRVIKVPPAYTSQDCSRCGERVAKSLSTRTHQCHACGYVADRDENAAKNIQRLGLESLREFPQEAATIAIA